MTHTRKKGFYGWIVVAGAALRYFSQAGPSYFSFAVFLPIICIDFDWTRAAVSGVVSLRDVLMTSLGPIAGALIVKFGARKILVYAAILGALGLALMYTIQEAWQIYLTYGIMVGSSLSLGQLGQMTIVNNWFIRKRALAIALVSAGAGLSGFAFPPLTAWLTSAMGWRPTFLVLSSIILVLGAVVSGLIIRNKPEDMGQVPDGIATEDDEETKTKTAPPLRVYQTPVDWEVKQAMKQPTTWIIILSGIASGFAIATMQTHQVAYLQDIGFSSMIAASALGIIPGLAIAGHLVIGVLANRIEVRYLAILCAVIRVIALVILLNATTLPLIYLYSALLGLAFGGTIIIRPLFIGAYYGRTHFALISGWMSLFSVISTALGPIVAGAIYDATSTYQPVFIIMLASSAVGGLGYFFARPPKVPAELLHSN